VELEAEDQPFEQPPWLGEEVTGDPRYYNANLVSNPYRNWMTQAPESSPRPAGQSSRQSSWRDDE
jgi:hypothetical protein